MRDATVTDAECQSRCVAEIDRAAMFGMPSVLGTAEECTYACITYVPGAETVYLFFISFTVVVRYVLSAALGCLPSTH